ncbi:pyridoxal phosphate-dependent aminotransferase [Candidatus Bathyarchaeota archaeon]|nr:pyridoxal phosphate-dependent aminotransferase [Candidatus Bathyarchaeota archaeon]MBS7628497.1 pyridoxal phosphate-dependent aminotransferase [Candidatus Bathyarchaeota archaeon]
MGGSRNPGHAERMNRAGTETAFEVFAMAKEIEKKGERVIHFEMGEPDFDTPENIKEAAKRALEEGYTHYTPAPGILELRQAIAEYVSEDFGVDIDPEKEVIVMPGAKPGIFTGILATVNPGDEVIMPNPAFPIYESVVNLVGAKPVPIPLREENDFRLSPEDVRRKLTEKTKMLILNTPHNPCGSTLRKSEVEEIAEIAKEHNLWVMSDEIYSKIIYGSKHYSMLSVPGMKERTILIHGFSKTYAMTGWRLGYSIGNPEVIANMVKLQINISSCAAAFSQIAAIEALRGPQDFVSRMVREYERRRDTIVQALNSIKGFSCKTPTGAFYAFPNIEKTGMKSRDLMLKLLSKAHVACVHGTAFGEYGEGHLRFSYATSIENIKEGMERVKATIEEL